MAEPHLHEPNEPLSCPSTERRRFTCNGPPLYRVSLTYSRNLQRSANVYYRQTRLNDNAATSTDNQSGSGHNAASIQSESRTGHITCGSPASHPPHSSHCLVTTDLHARRCTIHLSCTHTRTSNLLIISSLRYNQLRPTNPAVYLSIGRTLNSYSTINSAFHYKN
jgi:hypothetical protein